MSFDHSMEGERVTIGTPAMRQARVARFDDLRPGRRRGFSLDGITRTIVAHRPEEVPGALAEADAHVQAGRQVAGWVAYEAAPVFDTAFSVRSRTGTAFASLPLAWFAVTTERCASPGIVKKGYSLGPWRALSSPDRHRVAVDQIQERIRAGDTYQVNHTFLLRSCFDGDPASLYQRLVRSQSCGYGAFIDAGDWVVLSASPELFFEWRDGVIECRPMKGTARRGVDGPSDEEKRVWLTTSEKNRAENLMIVDMVRNDLGRLARVGSVEVPALFTPERYDTVWQLTSTVTARPRPGTTLVDVFGALFPSASITGAPKVSTMRIISNLENHPRGVYCGAVGYGVPGRAGPEWVFNVGIRTVLIHRPSGAAYYGTGGGVTYDSQPDDEYEEALLKAEVLHRSGKELRLLETTRWDPNAGARHLAGHLERVAASADYFGIPLDPSEVWGAITEAVTERDDPAMVRIEVDREGRVAVEVKDLPAVSLPVKLAIDDRPVDRLDPFLHHKTTIRDVHRAASARHPDSDDVILWNQDREVTETTIGNLAIRLDGEWVTPPVSSGLLAGTERAARLASGELTEQAVTLDELPAATGLARLNSVRGWEQALLISS